MNYLFIDTETRPTSNDIYIEKIRQEIREKDPPRNLKRELKAMWDEPDYQEERFQEAYRKTALDVLWAELLCIGYTVNDEPVKSINLWDFDEKKLFLSNFVKILSDLGQNTIIIGHNIKRFDLPIIKNELARNRIYPPGFCYEWKVYDTMLKTPCSNGLGMVSLDNACLSMELGQAKTMEWQEELMSGARVWDAYQAGEYNLIAEYCRRDVDAVRSLFNALTFNGTIGISRDELYETLREEIKCIDSTEIPIPNKYDLLKTVLYNRGFISS